MKATIQGSNHQRCGIYPSKYGTYLKLWQLATFHQHQQQAFNNQTLICVSAV